MGSRGKLAETIDDGSFAIGEDKNLIYNYIPWSRHGKQKRSITQSRYGTAAKRPTTATEKFLNRSDFHQIQQQQ